MAPPPLQRQSQRLIVATDAAVAMPIAKFVAGVQVSGAKMLLHAPTAAAAAAIAAVVVMPNINHSAPQSD